MAQDTINHSLHFYAGLGHWPGYQLVMPMAVTRNALDQFGFDLLGIGGEGRLALPGRNVGESFFDAEYHGLEGVYEVIAERRK